jgi:hypothetical protein
MKTLIYIEDVFEGSAEQFTDCFFTLGDLTKLTMKQIEDEVIDWCKQMCWNLLCVTEVPDEHFDGIMRSYGK